jgi:hypothetical protein
MFDDPPRPERSSLAKILIPVVIVFGLSVSALLYFSRSESAEVVLTGILRKSDPEYARYSNYVILNSTSPKLGKNFAGHRFVIFSGTIENKGDRTLDVIELKLTLFNYDEPVYEVVRTPFRPGGYPALKPLSDRSFTLYLENIPENWLAGHAEMELNGFRLEGN